MWPEVWGGGGRLDQSCGLSVRREVASVAEAPDDAVHFRVITDKLLSFSLSLPLTHTHSHSLR